MVIGVVICIKNLLEKVKLAKPTAGPNLRINENSARYIRCLAATSDEGNKLSFVTSLLYQQVLSIKFIL